MERDEDAERDHAAEDPREHAARRLRFEQLGVIAAPFIVGSHALGVLPKWIANFVETLRLIVKAATIFQEEATIATANWLRHQSYSVIRNLIELDFFTLARKRRRDAITR